MRNIFPQLNYDADSAYTKLKPNRWTPVLIWATKLVRRPFQWREYPDKKVIPSLLLFTATWNHIQILDINFSNFYWRALHNKNVYSCIELHHMQRSNKVGTSASIIYEKLVNFNGSYMPKLLAKISATKNEIKFLLLLKPTSDIRASKRYIFWS